MMDTIVQLEKHMTLVHEVDIQTSPDKIWDFLVHINKNYSAWHPGDHILFFTGIAEERPENIT